MILPQKKNHQTGWLRPLRTYFVVRVAAQFRGKRLASGRRSCVPLPPPQFICHYTTVSWPPRGSRVIRTPTSQCLKKASTLWQKTPITQVQIDQMWSQCWNSALCILGKDEESKTESKETEREQEKNKQGLIRQFSTDICWETHHSSPEILTSHVQLITNNDEENCHDCWHWMCHTPKLISIFIMKEFLPLKVL